MSQQEPQPDDPMIAAAFLDRYLRDQEAGGAKELAHYQELFAGHEDLVAREYTALRVDAEVAPTEPGTGRQTIAHYELIDELGRGGQGVVYKARDLRLKRLVALKVLRGGPNQRELLPRFRREAEVASRLHHPGICTILDSGESEGAIYIAMQFVEGQSLAQKIAASEACPSSREEILQVAQRIEKAAGALHAAHQAGIVHRDIKPGNIMITPEGEPVLLDFGLARDESQDMATLTQTGDVFGTPAYMSPEQLRGEGSRLDRRTDVYSLGATLFEYLTLRAPFVAKTRESLYRAILEDDAQNPQSLSPALPQDLAVVVLTALEKEPGRRYQTAGGLAEDLARVRRREPIRARPVPSWVKAWRWVQRNRMVASLAALLFVVLSVSLVVIWRQNQGLAQELEDARAGRRSKKQKRLQELIEQGFQTLFAANPTGADGIFDQALALDPSNKTALAGRYWYEIGNPTRALAVLDRYPDQRDPDVLWMRGLVLELFDRSEEARRYFGQAGSRDSSLRAYLMGLREVNSFHSRDISAATRALGLFREAVLRAPAPQFHYFHSLLMAASYAKDEATMKEAAAMLEHHWPRSPGTLDAIAQFFCELDPPRAERAMRELLKLRPAAAPCIGLASLALQKGDKKAAMKWYDKAVKIEPGFAAAWFVRGELWKGMGEIEKARSDYRKSIECEQSFYLAAIELAKTYREQNDTAAAIQVLEDYIQKVQDHPMAKAAAEKTMQEYRNNR